MDELLDNNWLAVVGYPILKESDWEWINKFRKEHDDYYDLVDAHFSFVFPDLERDKDEFINEVRKQAMGQRKIDFQIKSAIRNNDRTNDYWHILLAPDMGFSDIVKLHGKLYSGLFKPIERLDLDFVPHMGIGNTTSPEECKILVDKINEMNIDIYGTIDQLDIIQYKDNKISTISVVKLC